MTFRMQTTEETAEQARLETAAESAQDALKKWTVDNAWARSSLKKGDEAYDMETGRLVGTIRDVVYSSYYSWECANNRIIDNNSHSYGKPALGTKREALENMRRRAEDMMQFAQQALQETKD